MTRISAAAEIWCIPLLQDQFSCYLEARRSFGSRTVSNLIFEFLWQGKRNQ